MLLRGGASRAHIFSVHLFYAVCYKKSTGAGKAGTQEKYLYLL